MPCTLDTDCKPHYDSVILFVCFLTKASKSLSLSGVQWASRNGHWLLLFEPLNHPKNAAATLASIAKSEMESVRSPRLSFIVRILSYDGQ